MSSLYLGSEYASLAQGELNVSLKGCLLRERSRSFADLFLEDTDR